MVKIGKQIWFAENLRYMPHVSPCKVEGGIWVYDYNGTNVNAAKQTENYKKFGCLYDWKIACKSAPNGWHLPTDDEWKQLEMELGMNKIEVNKIGNYRGDPVGKILKSSVGWYSNENRTNDIKFSALLAGYRYGDGSGFNYEGINASFWSSTADGSSDAFDRGLGYSSGKVYRGSSYQSYGFSVRCLRDSTI